MIFRDKYIKSIIACCVMSVSATAFSATSSDRNQKIEEPYRVTPNRAKLLNDVTSEKVQDALNPYSTSEAFDARQEVLDNKRNVETPLHDPERMNRTILVKPEDRNDIQTLYLSPDHNSVFTLVDKGGNPYKIDTYVQSLGEKVYHQSLSNNSILLIPKVYFGRGNLTIKLKDNQNTILSFPIEISDIKVDYRTELRINEYSPDSRPVFLGDGSVNPNEMNDLSSMAKFMQRNLMSLLDGVTPEGYKKKITDKPDVEVWSKDKYMFVRTKDQLISPAIIPIGDYNPARGSDGQYVYVVPNLPYVILVRNGQSINVKIK